MGDDRARWPEAIATLLRSSYLAQPGAIAGLVNEAVRPMGVDIVIYLADREQECLRPLPEPGKPTGEPLLIDGSLAGQVYRRGTGLTSPQSPTRVWLPILDGSARLGVLSIGLPDDLIGPATDDGLSLLTVLVGHILVAKTPYGDSLRLARRSRPMSVGGELLWRMLPPLTFGAENLIISAIMEPCYDVGGDAYDYAVDDDLARIAIFDAVGHDLNAALTATLSVAASRAARTSGADLPEVAARIDQALTSQFNDLRFVTGVLAELDLTEGALRLVNAGHPPPLLVRAGRSVAVLDGGRRLPMGLGGPADDPAEYPLEPDDLLLFYTDGVTEAHRSDDEELFGRSRLAELVEHQAADDLPAPEIARGLANAVLDYQHGQPHDDATLIIVQWGPAAGHGRKP